MQPVKDIPEASGYGLREGADHGDPVQEQTPGRNCSQWRGIHTRTGSLAGTVTHCAAVCTPKECILHKELMLKLWKAPHSRAG